MILAIRILILVACPLIFWGMARLFPEILAAEKLLYLTAVFGIVWVLQLLVFGRLNDLSALEGLAEREHERLGYQLIRARRRVWWVGGVCLFSTAALFILSTQPVGFADRDFLALAVGTLIGIAGSYIAIIPFWAGEIHSFIDKVRARNSALKQRESAVKHLADSAQ